MLLSKNIGTIKRVIFLLNKQAAVVFKNGFFIHNNPETRDGFGGLQSVNEG